VPPRVAAPRLPPRASRSASSPAATPATPAELRAWAAAKRSNRTVISSRSVSREDLVGQLDGTFDVLVVGGGATGLGTALDAVTRGYRAAKLVHGGVRYLEKGDIGLVREALHERFNLRRNAPHLVDALGFIRWSEGPYYFAGLKAYDVLAGESEFPTSTYLNRAATLKQAPDLRATVARQRQILWRPIR
jgi:glycerol-3-phosphate dehydrogenase